MTERKMTIARGMTRLKTLTAQIENCLNDMQRYAAGNTKTISPASNQKDVKSNHPEVSKLMASTMQQFQDLCAAKTKLKLAIDAANASTVITVAGRTFTIAEALVLRNAKTGVMQHYERAAAVLAYAVSNANTEVIRYNQQYSKITDAEALATLVADVAYFVKAEDITKLRDFTTVFRAEIEGTLNEVNAITEINLD
ncbi:MAG: hypothetical protein PHY48_14465 [Candidatus Cloacimonetes bacterium]|nr:hypothetical protein [Candidatus Cloacimonadota bacterium]